MTNQPSTIQQVTYTSEIPGPSLLVLGGIHGNETCGPIAIRRVMAELESGALRLERGQVTFVPICNPEAARQGLRFVERNLNRFLVPTENPTTYEARLGNILCPLLERCDVLLDLHSYYAGDEAFVFVDQTNNPAECAFAECLGPRKLATGWEQAYAAAGRKPPENPDEPTGTTEYARRFRAIAATIECGKHDDPAASGIAYDAIRNALLHLGLIEGTAPLLEPASLIKAQIVVYREREGSFAQKWKNFAPLAKGNLIATYEDGAELRAPGDGYIIMPHEDTAIGTEWYYLGAE